MASIIPVGNKFRAQIRRAGQPTLTKTWATEQEAKDWAAIEEGKFLTGKNVGVMGVTGITFKFAIDRYIKEKKNVGRSPLHILEGMKEGMGHILLEKLTAQHIVAYIQSKGITAGSGAVHFSYIRSVLKMAKIGWDYHVPEILDRARDRLKILKLVGKSNERDRLPTDEELEMLLSYKFPTKIPMADIIRFAISSAMRQAEITRIDHATFNEKARTILITDRKHPTKKIGNHKTVPLLAESVDLIKAQPIAEGDTRVFPYRSETLGEYFRAACKKLGIVDLHFHDLRHLGTTRLFQMGYKIDEVQMFTGHEDWKMLQRYTHLKAENVRRFETPKAVKPVAFEMDDATMEQFKMFQAMQAMMRKKAA